MPSAVSPPPAAFRALFERSTAPQLLVRASDGAIVEANAAAAVFFGLPREGLTSLGVATLVGDVERWEDVLDLAATVGVHLSTVGLQRGPGDARPIEMYGSPVDDALVHFIVHDVAERVRAEERARELHTERVARALTEAAAAEWQETFDAIPLPIVVVDGDGRWSRGNHAAIDLAGSAAPHVQGRRLADLPDQSLWGEVARSASGGALADRVIDGRGRTWEVTVLPPDDDGGAVGRTIVVLRELTAVIALQEEVGRRETMARMGALVGGVAHEVRNPLFAISSLLDAARRRLGDHPDFARVAPLLDQQVERLSALMRDLLEYGRPAALERQATPVDALVEAARSSVASLAERGEVTLRVTPAATEGTAVWVDRLRFGQVLVNLLSNAIQHSAAGSVVELVWRRWTEEARGGVEFMVFDEGPGFPPDLLARVFEPFVTRRPGGTGLGLALAYRAVHEHGATITAQNRVGPSGEVAGAVVTVRMPDVAVPHSQPGHP